jgi:hypothetical protein
MFLPDRTSATGDFLELYLLLLYCRLSMIAVARVLLEAEVVGGACQEIAHVVVQPGGGDPIVDTATRRCWPAATPDLVVGEADWPAFERGAGRSDSPALQSAPASTRSSGWPRLCTVVVRRRCCRPGGGPRKTSGYYPLPLLLDVVGWLCRCSLL